MSGRLFISPSAMQMFMQGALRGDLMIDVDPERGVFEAVKVDGAPRKAAKHLHRKAANLLPRPNKQKRGAGKGSGARKRKSDDIAKAIGARLAADGIVPRAALVAGVAAQGYSNSGVYNVLKRMVASGDAWLDETTKSVHRGNAAKAA